ncbi:MAG: RidA family protein [Chloroflexi bacterium]|nr:RidA family protein [Chloroflexota bacterium]
MAIERIQPAGLSKPPTYCHVVKTGNTVYIAGQTSQDANGQVVGAGDFAAQATQVFENIKTALESVGANFSNLVRIMTYITDPRYRDPLNEVRTKYLTSDLPTSTLLVVTGLANPAYLIEIDAIAVLE